MGSPFLGEVRIMSFGFAPKGWAQCNGQSLPVAQNQVLFTLLGHTFGGAGAVFQLPDLRTRVAVHEGAGRVRGQKGGAQTHTLADAEMPLHTHRVNVDGGAPASNVPSADAIFASSSPVPLWGPASGLVAMSAAAVSTVGNGQAHANEMPYLTLNFCIALQGVAPTKPGKG